MPLPPEQQQQLALRQQWAQHWQQKESLDAGECSQPSVMAQCHPLLLLTRAAPP